MSEEFKSIRITLSEEAFDRMEEIMKKASFRSYSSTVEECIRAIYDVIRDLNRVMGTEGKLHTPTELAYEYKTIATRLSRFTGAILEIRSSQER